MVRAISTLLLVGLFGIGVSASADPIRIESGTYGSNCGARQGNATRQLALRCNSADTCSYPVALPTALRTSNACRADFVAEWFCGPSEFHRAVVSAPRITVGLLR